MSSARKRQLISILILAAEFVVSWHPAAARNLVISRELIEDPSGKLTIGDVLPRAGTEMGPDWKVGSTDWVYWVRLRVHAPANGSKVVLFILPSYLNEVRLFEPNASHPSGWRTRVTGNVYPFADRDRASASLGFVINVSAPEETYYLRIKTRSPLSLQVQGLEPEEAAREDHQRDLLEVFFVTSMGFLFLWALHTYFLYRQPVMGWFALHLATYTLFGIAATGYLAPLNPPRSPHFADWANAILYLTINFTCALLCRALLKAYDPAPPIQRVLDLLPWAFPILLGTLVAGYDALAINVNAALIKLSLLFFLITAFFLRREHVPSRRLLQAFFSVIFLYNLLFWYAARVRLTSLSRDFNLNAIQALVFDGFIFGALFAWVLHASSRQVIREGNESAMQLLLVQKQFELEQELKKQLEVQAQMDHLTGIYNRRRFLELAESEFNRSIRYGRPLVFLMIDVDHFKQFNDTWGHGAGDLVLQRVSQLICESLRSNDIFARYGGEEFAVLLPETAEAEALTVGQRICTTVANAVIAVPATEGVHVTVSIGLAGTGERWKSLNALIGEADRAMYCAKQAGRNCTCLSNAGPQPAVTSQATKEPS